MRALRFKDLASYLSAISILTLSSPATAATLSIAANNQGFFNEFGQTNFRQQQGNIGNTFTGEFRVRGSNTFVEFRSFFVFDVRTLTAPIQSASVRLFQENYFSSVGQETVQVRGTTTPVSDFQNPLPSLELGLSIFEDIGTGNIYGEGTIAAAPTTLPSGTPIRNFLDITLNNTALDALNQAREESGFFTFGVILSSLNSTPYIDLFFGEDNGAAEGVTFSTGLPFQDVPSLIVVQEGEDDPDTDPPRTIPEPGLVFGSILAMGLALSRRWS